MSLVIVNFYNLVQNSADENYFSTIFELINVTNQLFPVIVNFLNLFTKNDDENSYAGKSSYFYT